MRTFITASSTFASMVRKSRSLISNVLLQDLLSLISPIPATAFPISTAKTNLLDFPSSFISASLVGVRHDGLKQNFNIKIGPLGFF